MSWCDALFLTAVSDLVCHNNQVWHCKCVVIRFTFTTNTYTVLNNKGCPTMKLWLKPCKSRMSRCNKKVRRVLNRLFPLFTSWIGKPIKQIIMGVGVGGLRVYQLSNFLFIIVLSNIYFLTYSLMSCLFGSFLNVWLLQ